MLGSNPFNKWKMGFRLLQATPGIPGGGQLTPANSRLVGASVPSSGMGRTRSRAGMGEVSTDMPDPTAAANLQQVVGQPVALPANLFAPPGSQALDLTANFTVPAVTIIPIPIFSFTAPQGQITQILGYAFTNPAPNLVFFTPAVNGFRVWPYQGDPSNNFALTVPTGPDLSSLKQAQLVLKPGDVFQWLVSNVDAAAHAVSVRTNGYMISTIKIQDTRFGG